MGNAARRCEAMPKASKGGAKRPRGPPTAEKPPQRKRRFASEQPPAPVEEPGSESKAASDDDLSELDEAAALRRSDDDDGDEDDQDNEDGVVAEALSLQAQGLSAVGRSVQGTGDLNMVMCLTVVILTCECCSGKSDVLDG